MKDIGYLAEGGWAWENQPQIDKGAP